MHFQSLCYNSACSRALTTIGHKTKSPRKLYSPASVTMTNESSFLQIIIIIILDNMSATFHRQVACSSMPGSYVAPNPKHCHRLIFYSRGLKHRDARCGLK